jgi:hypothetical protein
MLTANRFRPKALWSAVACDRFVTASDAAIQGGFALKVDFSSNNHTASHSNWM